MTSDGTTANTKARCRVATDTLNSSRREIGNEPSLLIDATTLAALLSVSEATLYRMLAGGKIPAPLRLSRGCVRWHRETVERWLAASEAQGRLIDRASWETLCANTNGKR